MIKNHEHARISTLKVLIIQQGPANPSRGNLAKSVCLSGLPRLDQVSQAAPSLRQTFRTRDLCGYAECWFLLRCPRFPFSCSCYRLREQKRNQPDFFFLGSNILNKCVFRLANENTKELQNENRLHWKVVTLSSILKEEKNGGHSKNKHCIPSYPPGLEAYRETTPGVITCLKYIKFFKW